MFLLERHRSRLLGACRAAGHIALLLALAAACFGQAGSPSAPKKLLQGSPQDRLEQAETLLKPLVRADPNNPKYLFELGDVYLLMGRPEQAIPLLQKSLHLMPGSWDARMALAQAYQKSNDDAGALRALGKTPPAGPKAELWTFTRAFSLYRLGDGSAALPLFKQLLDNKEMRAPANFFVANCYSGLVQYQAALPYYEAAIEFGQCLAVIPSPPSPISSSNFPFPRFRYTKRGVAKGYWGSFRATSGYREPVQINTSG